MSNTVFENISALVNQDFKDLEGLPIRKRLDQTYYNSELLLRLQNGFTQTELVRWFTVDRASVTQEFSTVKCMPNAFPLAVNTTNQLFALFQQRFLTSHYGGISDFICEFVEDD